MDQNHRFLSITRNIFRPPRGFLAQTWSTNLKITGSVNLHPENSKIALLISHDPGITSKIAVEVSGITVITVITVNYCKQRITHWGGRHLGIPKCIRNSSKLCPKRLSNWKNLHCNGKATHFQQLYHDKYREDVSTIADFTNSLSNFVKLYT